MLRGLAAEWPAVTRWDREYFLSRWGDVRVSTALGLPSHGVPFLAPASTFRRERTVRTFWNDLEGARCWLDEQPFSLFAGLEDDVRMQELMSARPRLGLNLWIGRGTKSGLHFDPTDNLLVMIRGDKFAALAAPGESRRLYPFYGSIMKSRVDVEHPDFVRFPRAASAELQVAWLTAGDVLYIPGGWWHYLASPSESHHISVTCSFGRQLSLSFLASYLLRLGPAHVARVLRDFIVYGAFGRPCIARFHDVPNGLQLYRRLRTLSKPGGRADDGGVQEVGCTSPDLPVLAAPRRGSDPASVHDASVAQSEAARARGC